MKTKRTLLSKLWNVGFLHVFDRVSTEIYSRSYNIRYNTKIRLKLSSKIYGRNGMNFGKDVFIGHRCRIDCIFHHGADIYNPLLLIGDYTTMNDDVHIGCIGSVRIGKNVLMASKIYISDHNHGVYDGLSQDSPNLQPNRRKLYWKEVVIEDNVWLGEGVAVMPGVKIGYGSIIGANSVVTKDIPPLSIAVGSPAKVVKAFNTVTEQWERVK